MPEPQTDEPQDDAQAMRSDMSDKAFSVASGEIVRSVQVPRDGGDNADATSYGKPEDDSGGPAG